MNHRWWEYFFTEYLIKIFKNPKTKKVEAFGRYRTVFYDSPKFDLSAKLLNEGEKFNLYRNDTLATGETERMIYFSKFFTEQLYNADTSKFVLKMLDKVDDTGKVIINEATGKPEKEFIKLGADAIIGSHPHIVNPHLTYKGKDIYFSLGNFLFPDICLEVPRPMCYPNEYKLYHALSDIQVLFFCYLS